MDLQAPTSGKVIDTEKGYLAYLPHPLPPTFRWTLPLLSALSRADYLLGQLAQEGRKFLNPDLLMRSFMMREAVLSSKIEGAQTTLGEALVHTTGIAEPQHNDAQEIHNYMTALDFGLKRLDTLPLSLRFIKEIHAHLMQGVRGSHATPGEFRKTQNWIGPPGCTLNTAKYVPPPVEHLPDTLSALEAFLHDRTLPPLIHIALCHYQFEAIHPFLDGNGRVGRLLNTLLLIEQKMLPSPLLYLSAFFEATRDNYYRQLFSVSNTGDWQGWLIYFLNGVAMQSEDALSRIERINHLLEKWKLAVASGASQVAVQIVERLAANPFLTIKKTAETLGIAYSTADRGVQKLLANNIIKQVKEGKRYRMYCATELLDILEEPAKVDADFEGF